MMFAQNGHVLVLSRFVGDSMNGEDAEELGGLSVATVGRWYLVFSFTGAF